jgi:hypothetical protein
LVFTGAPTANCNVVAPSVSKIYVVSNETTGGFIVNMKTAAGDPLPITTGSRQLVFCNGTAFTSVVNPNAIQGNLSISGGATIGGNVTSGTTIIIRKDVTSTSNNMSLASASNVVSFKENTGALKIPSGTTGQRPAAPVLGMQRWNSDIGVVEVWNGSIWLAITGATQGVYLVVAGGGGGGANAFEGSGGGGAGGLLSGTFFANVATSYSIVVGSGGGVNAQGLNSSGFGVVAIGGGAGAGTSGAINGGSGGGRNTRDRGEENYGPGSGTAGQGFAGSAGISGYTGAGGGGASQTGQGINGGAGIQSSINGTATFYAGGGGGGDRQAGPGGIGGSGGGGTRSPGVANTGGGGAGGGSDPGGYGGGAGGSGIVIAAYASTFPKATGGTITTYTNGGITYYVHTFTTSGTLAF